MKLTDGERLIAMMLADIGEALQVKGEFDYSFISKVLHSNDSWSLPIHYESLGNDGGPSKDLIDETVGILNAWRDITFSVGKLEESDRQSLKGGIGRYEFPGFDGHGTHYSIAKVWLEDLQRFPELKNFYLNSHCENIDYHREVVKGLRELGKDSFGKRTKDQLEKLIPDRVARI